MQVCENELNSWKFQETETSLRILKSQGNLDEILKTKTALLIENRDIDLKSEILSQNCEDFKDDLNKFEQELSELNRNFENLGVKKSEMENEILEYEKGLEKLKKDCDELKIEFEAAKGVNECEKMSEKCVFCLQPRLGRVKYCIKCQALAHAKCTKEVRFVCDDCK